ncbi:GfV-B43-ORF1 [Ichnoviriform fumiferanae]|uniref:GfV-B43-ORF1 n=1 Tax=Ichnoviriform fumiferanae TaxID=419435 RepID=A2PZT9_9VIRU|nr:GfV-B43-ORF1 [Ichnoviriform fumiferanae]BAF45511.1 GfV-B43-ORF1 [Ichnoviriform fumiferanae]
MNMDNLLDIGEGPIISEATESIFVGSNLYNLDADRLQFEYEMIRSLSHHHLFRSARMSSLICPTTQAFSDPENKMKNRSQSVPCWDHSRVKLSNSPRSDYIHANWIKGFDGARKFIGSQAPMTETINDHLDMIWQTKSTIIVVLTKIYDNDVELCYPYWSSVVNNCRKTEKYIVETKKVIDRPGYTKYLLKLKNSEITNDSRDVSLYHYTNWPEHRTPENIIQFIDLIMAINNEQHVQSVFQGNFPGPIVVHDSDNVNCTGTFCAIDLCIDIWLMKKRFNVQAVVKYVRRMRHSSVPTVDHYFFIYRVLADFVNLDIEFVY